ncbi:MAG TPA: BTAD domain-containing putative transcriptional regulator [Pseudonocardiaceae bacterium]|nr:BTAD domain-containing putative transcriptional regulator [Pseudonocardiaceae bacterium]
MAEADREADRAQPGPEPGLRLAVLGPVSVAVDGEPIPIGSPGARAVLMLLVLGANRVVPMERIVDGLWGDDPPATARTMVHGYVSRLRRVLDSVDGRHGSARIITHPPGYELRVDETRLDVHEVRRLLELARGQPPVRRAGLLRAAAAIWRGPVAADPPTADVTAELAELRLVVTTERVDADLELGRHAEVIGELRALVRAHPFDEGLVGQLIRALYGSGLRAEALDCYLQLRRRMAVELGIDPGPELRELYERLLRDDPRLRSATSADGQEPAPTVVPAQLPLVTSTFTGREPELSWLDGVLDRRDPDGTAIAVITGPAGVGKSALALHWGHRRLAEFPDGVLFAPLRGFAATQPPVAAADVLHRFLIALGVPAENLPDDGDEQAALYRSLLASRRVLVVLDDARDSAHVRPLLAGGPGSLVLVTSRRRLDGLVAGHGARLLPLAALPTEPAVRLISEVAAEAGVAVTGEQAGELARLCDHLPLALRIVAARLTGEPSQSADGLLAELTDEHTRLAALDLEDADTSVRAALDVSYRGLRPPIGDVFRLLGLVPGPIIDPHPVAALCGAEMVEVRRWLRALAEANLLSEVDTDRFVMHDLVRLHARSLVASLAGAQRVEASHRMLRYYLVTCDVARRLLYPPTDDLDFSAEAGTLAVPPLRAAADAVAWFDAEWHNLRALLRDAEASGRQREVWQLVLVASHYLTRRTSYSEWSEWGRIGLAAARAAEDRVGEVLMLIVIATAQSRYERAGQHLADATRALRAATELGDPRHIRRALGNMAGAFYGQGRYREALACDQQSYRLAVDAGDRAEQARALNDMSQVEWAMGRSADAVRNAQASVELLRELGDVDGYRLAMDNLAELYVELSRLDEADQLIAQVLELSTGGRPDLQYAFARKLAGQVLLARGDPRAAAELRAALALSEGLDGPHTPQIRELLAGLGADRADHEAESEQ